MSVKKLCRVAFCLAGLVPAVALAVTTQTAQVSEVHRLVDQLGDPSPDVRQAAETSIELLPPADFAALDLAAKRPDLNPEASRRLNAILNRIRPWQAARERRAAVHLAEWQFNLNTALDAYNRVGRHNPKWDDDAREGIRRFVSINNASYRASARESLEKVIAAGCDDPLILYLEARASEQSIGATSDSLERLYHMAEEGMEKSDYPADRKVFAVLRYLSFKLRYERNKGGENVPPFSGPVEHTLRGLLDTAIALWLADVKEKGIPGSWLLAHGQMILDDSMQFASAGGREAAFKALYPALQKALPNSPVPLVFKGRFYTQWAWDARGNGYADTVTPLGAKWMEERLNVAKQALTEAWRLDPTDPDAATQMLTVELGLGNGPATMEQWFKRAMDADPDNYTACAHKLYYLEPKWYGSPEEELAFGRECRDGKNWYAEMPFLLVSAHEALSAYASDPDAYFRDPAVWDDLKSVYEPYLAARPRNNWVRSRFAYWACRCGQWAEARRQFDLLGSHALPQQFGGQQQMNRFRQMAEGNGSNQAP